MSGILKKKKVMDLSNTDYELKFYEDFNAEGKVLNFLEVSMPFGDRIILDGENMEELEKRLRRILPVALQSRRISEDTYYPQMCIY